MAVRTLRYNTFEGRTWKGATFVTDTDALAFCEAAQIYDRNQQKAIVDLVRRLKTAGLWSKMKAIYPFIGGTATTHKWNLKDPRDVNAAFRLSFLGGWTHSANGAQPNGTNGYADSFLIPNNSLSISSLHTSFYSRTNQAAGNIHDAGCVVTSPSLSTLVLILKYASDNAIWQTPGGATNSVNVSNTNSTGYYIGTRTATNLMTLYKNNTTLGTNTNTYTQTFLPTNSFVFSVYKQDTLFGTQSYSTKEIAFATIGDGLTGTDATNLYNIVDLYQRRLGRNV